MISKSVSDVHDLSSEKSDSLSLHSSEENDANSDDNRNYANRKPRKRTRRWLYCSHCKQKVSNTTYYRHKKLRISEEEAGDLVDFSDTERVEIDTHSSEAALIGHEIEMADDDFSSLETVGEWPESSGWHIEVISVDFIKLASCNLLKWKGLLLSLFPSHCGTMAVLK